MLRAIIGFDIDSEGDPLAILSCGHPQHVRHRPPFISRPWVTTEEGRRSKLGERLNCVRCERFELPAHFVAHRKTPILTEETAQSVLDEQKTEAGVWARIVVLEGRVRCTAETPRVDMVLGTRGTFLVVPEASYRIQPLRGSRFFIEYLAAPKEVADSGGRRRGE